MAQHSDNPLAFPQADGHLAPLAGRAWLRYGRMVARLIHLNGPPGVGKSTLARRYAADHPGTLLCDIDRLRTMIGGWRDDDGAAGRIRTAALAMITAYLRAGGDVVVPQLVATVHQLNRFRQAADAAEAAYTHIVLTAAPEETWRRAGARTDDDAEWLAHVNEQLDQSGGLQAIRQWMSRLEALPGRRVESSAPEATYDALVQAIG